MHIISEIGINHNGDFKKIEELIRQSAEGGADFAKFQLYDSVRVFGDNSRKKNEFTFEEIKKIKRVCDAYNIEFFASVFDEEKLKWCLDVGVDFFKIASRTVIKEKELCNKIIATGKKTFVSLGFWDQENLPFDNDNVFYFNCISKYPTSILDLKDVTHRRYSDTVIGYSDHVYGIGSCLYHIANGASYIEKHFTLNKAMSGNDHLGSMDFEDLKMLRSVGDVIDVTRKNSGRFL